MAEEEWSLLASAGSLVRSFFSDMLGGDTCSWVSVVGHHASNFAVTKSKWSIFQFCCQLIKSFVNLRVMISYQKPLTFANKIKKGKKTTMPSCGSDLKMITKRKLHYINQGRLKKAQP